MISEPIAEWFLKPSKSDFWIHRKMFQNSLKNDCWIRLQMIGASVWKWFPNPFLKSSALRRSRGLKLREVGIPICRASSLVPTLWRWAPRRSWIGLFVWFSRKRGFDFSPHSEGACQKFGDAVPIRVWEVVSRVPRIGVAWVGQGRGLKHHQVSRHCHEWNQQAPRTHRRPGMER